MIVERGIHGNWFISEIIGNNYVNKQYIGYTRRQAVLRFKHEFYPTKTRYTVTLMVRMNSERTVLVLAKSEHNAIERAVTRIFGKTAWWWSDSGLGYEYGQVCKPVPQKFGGGHSCVTGRVTWNVVAGWHNK